MSDAKFDGVMHGLHKFELHSKLDRAIRYLEEIKEGRKITSFAWRDLQYNIDGLQKDVEDYRKNND